MTDYVVPSTRYTRSGELSIAYQTLGRHSRDIVVVPHIISQIEQLHEFPEYRQFLKGLGSFARVVTFDKSGQGLSDRPAGIPTLEQRMDDITAVMEATQCRKAIILGCSEGAALSVLFAATYPEMVSHLILFGGFARMTSTPDYEFGFPEDQLPVFDQMIDDTWGTGEASIRFFWASAMQRAEAVQQFAKLERLSASPSAYKAMIRRNALIDVRPILSSIRVPTLVLHRRNDALIRVENGQFLAERIPGAKFIEYDDCTDHFIFGGDVRRISNDIREFVVGAEPDELEGADRILATVLMTDIVDSTRRVGELGDRSWTDVLDEHDRMSERLARQHRGRFVASTGDGMVAIFDGPSRAVRCAMELSSAVRLNGLELRAGLHTGEIELRGGNVAGVAVHAAARVMAKAEPGEILVSRVLVDLVAGAGLSFRDRGEFDLKGFTGGWRLFAAQH